MDLLMPEMVDEAKLVDFQKAMQKDLKKAATKFKGKPLWFAVAKDVPLAKESAKKITMFVAVRKEAEAMAWLLKLKPKKLGMLAIGTCELTTG